MLVEVRVLLWVAVELAVVLLWVLELVLVVVVLWAAVVAVA
jgi:hypothetical protein